MEHDTEIYEVEVIRRYRVITNRPEMAITSVLLSEVEQTTALLNGTIPTPTELFNEPYQVKRVGYYDSGNNVAIIDGELIANYETKE